MASVVLIRSIDQVEIYKMERGLPKMESNNKRRQLVHTISSTLASSTVSAMSDIKPIKFYKHAVGPNPMKVKILLMELNIPHEAVCTISF
jgi:hypothetical protein